MQNAIYAPPRSETNLWTSTLQVLEEVHARITSYLAGLDETALETRITAPWVNDFPLFWILWHVINMRSTTAAN